MVPRRALLRSLGLAASATVAGCNGISWPGDRSTPNGDQRTPTVTPNATLAPPPTTTQPTGSSQRSATPALTEEQTPTVTEIADRAAFTPTGDGAASAFGTSVALSDDVALVDSDGERVHVFEAGDDGWHQAAVLTPGEEDRFGFHPVPLALEGEIAFVGAPKTASGGSVQLFERADDEWRRTLRLTVDETRHYDEFGTSVAVDGETLVAGDVRDPGTMVDYSGTVYVFEGSGTDWTRVDSLESDPSVNGDLFGRRVAVSGDTVLVGAPTTHGDDGSWAGKVYVYERAADGWDLATELVSPDGRADGEFGQTLALDGDTAVVGAPGGDDDETGVAYVFERSGSEWSERARVSGLGQFDYDDGPSGVALRGDTLLVGDPDASGSGRVRRFDRTREGWQRTVALVADDPDPADDFGYSVALGASEALVGAPAGGEDRRGRGYLFSL